MTTLALTLGHDMHARPVAEFCSAAAASGVPVSLGRPGAAIDGDNMLMIMSADLRAGETVELSVDGPHEVLSSLAALLLEAHAR